MHNRTIKIFVVEDNEWYNKLLVHTISLNSNFEVKSFYNGTDFLNCLDEKPDIITLDYKLPDFTGKELVKKIKKISPNTEIIVVSEQTEVAIAVELLKLNIYDYLVKEKEIRLKLINTINNIVKTICLQKELSDLQNIVEQKYLFSKYIIGESESIKKIEYLVSKTLDNNINVIITGETGTGKELVAKCIHFNSNRAKKPFVAVNVAAIPSELIESELFGHEKGSFTGAINSRIGKFEEANGGTLFLDEIGEMDISLQSKLLRALQEKEVTKVGSNIKSKINCRIIVATNKNLKQEIKNGNFREDLYYRLLGLQIELPPLRSRKSDILLISKKIIADFCLENKMVEKKLSKSAEKKLLKYNYPGNVRELKSIIDLSVVLSNNDIIEEDDILIENENEPLVFQDDEKTLKEYENIIVKSFLKKYNNNIKIVAEKLNIGTATIYRMLKNKLPEA